MRRIPDPETGRIPTWKRDRHSVSVPEEQPPRCGGPDYTHAQRAELRASAEQEQREKTEKVEQEGQERGEDKEQREKKDKRYAVTLLREDDVWGGRN